MEALVLLEALVKVVVAASEAQDMEARLEEDTVAVSEDRDKAVVTEDPDRVDHLEEQDTVAVSEDPDRVDHLEELV